MRKTIHQSGKHLLGVVNDMLDVAKIESGHMTLDPKPFDVRQILDELALAHAPLAQEKGLDLNTQFGDELPASLMSDPVRLRQVIHNLLNNAVKFTNQGSITLSAHWHNERLVVGVRDTGPGIDPAVQALVFERFRQGTAFMTREHGGTGLGLALVREFVGLMGGEVRLESEPGKGAYFEFWVPELNQATPEAGPVR
jgi:signal transduction histidine kinase